MRPGRPLRALCAVATMLLFLSACGSDPPARATDAQSTLHPATLEAGRAAVNDLLARTGADSISLSVTDGQTIAWAESFGPADTSTGVAATPDTLYCIASISKMFAAVATMKLVDEGRVSLDAPVVNYVPSFRMKSPEYTNITVRMLLNHSSGFPGSEARNDSTEHPFTGLSEQFLADVAEERLKYPPGYLNVYTNDGFLMVENLVKAVTGKSYPDYLHDEVLAPLGMTRSRFPTEFFPTDSFAHSTIDDEPSPQEFVNDYGSGGLYSSANDMARFGMMFLGKGAVGSTRILSEQAVDLMAVDQTQGTFNPIPVRTLRFGLGWDTVTQPGLATAGVPGWSKGGDVATGHGAFVVAPTEGLAVTVLGTANTDSGSLESIAERILLTELAARGRIAQVPPVLPTTAPAAATPSPAQQQALVGFWANTSGIWRMDARPDGTLVANEWNGSAWNPAITDLRLREDGTFSSDTLAVGSARDFATLPMTRGEAQQSTARTFFTVTASGRDYLGADLIGGYGEYRWQLPFAERVAPKGPLSPAWQARVGHIWIVANDFADVATAFGNPDPRLIVGQAAGLDGLIAVGPVVPQPSEGFTVLDPSASDETARVFLLIPGNYGRDTFDIDVFNRGGEDWIRYGSEVYRPLTTVPALQHGATTTATIGPEGYTEWRALSPSPAGGTVTVTTTGPWKLYDPDFTLVEAGTGNATVEVPATRKSTYLALFGAPGDRAEAVLSP